MIRELSHLIDVKTFEDDANLMIEARDEVADAVAPLAAGPASPALSREHT